MSEESENSVSRQEETARQTQPKKNRIGGLGRSFCAVLSHKKLWGGVLDVTLVLLVIGVVVGIFWYLNQELPKYRVPSPYELSLAENAKLRAERERLQPEAFRAEEQYLLKMRLEERQREIESQNRNNLETSAKIQEKSRQILAKQHEIRRTDKEYRQVAMSLLPGMNLGTVRTRKGSRVYYGTRVTRVEGKSLLLSHDQGMVRLHASDLVAESLPPLARYAFGVDDLLHIAEMNAEIATQSDAEEAEQQAPAQSAKKKETKASSRKKKTTSSYADLSPLAYEPPSAKPIVDVQLPPAPKAETSSMTDTSLIATPMNEVIPLWMKEK